ncbi:hypothetical protein L596_024674 [Steinernema carpocapsae]|uniref:RRM domain-containing protein n=1 Tax=Steinernema carpocapsae TaxID=34508 RepID=A0A4U5M5E9_STECR|nr:hypothetical protein L596_024674 [Steinernema carpocapsae]
MTQQSGPSSFPSGAPPPNAQPQESFDQQKNVFVKNFGQEFSQADLENLFAPYGEIVSSVVMKDSNGRSRGFGFVAFSTREQARDAIHALDKTVLPNGLTLSVSQAQRKQDRVAFLEQKRGVVLFVNYLDTRIAEDQIGHFFAQFGGVSSVRRGVYSTGSPKRYALITMQNMEGAMIAIQQANGALVSGQPISVEIARNNRGSPMSMTPPASPSPVHFMALPPQMPMQMVPQQSQQQMQPYPAMVNPAFLQQFDHPALAYMHPNEAAMVRHQIIQQAYGLTYGFPTPPASEAGTPTHSFLPGARNVSHSPKYQ